MANYALGAVGAIIGAPFGLAGLGFAVGFAIGNAIDPAEGPKISSPGLSDLSVQGSAEGGMMAIIFGCARTAGNIVWKTDLKEVITETEVGGKGGGPTQTREDKTYFLTMMVSVCETPGYIVRIWANEKVVFDARNTLLLGENPTNEEIFAAAFANKSVDSQNIFQFFLGDEDQQPSAIIESFEGVGNVPPYRGQVTVLFNEFPLEEYGNQAPNFTFEVCRCCFDSEVEIIGPTNNMMQINETFEFTHTGSSLCPSFWKIVGGPNDGLTHSGDTFIVTAADDQNGNCDNNFIVNLNEGCVLLPVGVNKGMGNDGKKAVRSPKWFATPRDNSGCFLNQNEMLVQLCDGSISIGSDPQYNQTSVGCMNNLGQPWTTGPNGCLGQCGALQLPCLPGMPPECLGIGNWFNCARYGAFPYSAGWTILADIPAPRGVFHGWFPGVWTDARGADASLRDGSCCPHYLALTVDHSVPQDDISRRGDQYWNALPAEIDGREIKAIKAADATIVPPGAIAGRFQMGNEPFPVQPKCCGIVGDPADNCPGGRADCKNCFPWIFADR